MFICDFLTSTINELDNRPDLFLILGYENTFISLYQFCSFLQSIIVLEYAQYGNLREYLKNIF